MVSVWIWAISMLVAMMRAFRRMLISKGIPLA
jgi:hypothetical protein